MITIQIIITLLTISIGALATKKELKALMSVITEKEYIEMKEFNKILARRSNLV